YIGENRSSTHMKNGVDGGAKGQVRRDDLIARPDIESRKRKMHFCRALACSQRVVGPHIGCQLTLELCRAWTGCQPAGAQYLTYLAELLLTDRRPVERD